MKCPLCKDKELLPCRLTDRSIKPDGLKCPKCDAVFILDGTNHLKRVDGKVEAEATSEVQAEAW